MAGEIDRRALHRLETTQTTPCAFCGHPDPQHRVRDAILSRFLAGASIQSLVDDYALASWAIEAILRHAMSGCGQRTRVAEASQLNPTEALYGFMAWLTTREDSLSIGSTHECGQVVALLQQFCERHELPECRDDYVHRLRSGPQVACHTCGGSGTVLRGVDAEETVIDCPSCQGPR